MSTMILHGFIRTLIPLNGIYHKITVNKDKLVKKRIEKLSWKVTVQKFWKDKRKRGKSKEMRIPNEI